MEYNSCDTKHCQIFILYIFRTILRRHNCLKLLLDQLTSSSLTIVSNACGTLLNLSANCLQDQESLRALGAVPMLKHLTQSKHKTIATCSEGALRNLTVASSSSSTTPGSSTRGGGSRQSRERQPSLEARKRRNMMLEINDRLNDEAASDGDSEEGDSQKEEDNGVERNSRNGVQRAMDTLDSLDALGDRLRLNEGSPSSTAARQPLELSKSHAGQAFLKQAVPAQQEGVFLNRNDGFQSDQRIQQSGRDSQGNSFSPYLTDGSQQMSLQAPALGHFPTDSPLSPDVEAFAERDERIMSPSVLHTNDDDERPTDYSARFGDDDDNDVEVVQQQQEEQVGSAEVEDTVRTYCVEGTPYDTPFVTSHAGSMSDLREQPLVVDDRDQRRKEGAFDEAERPYPPPTGGVQANGGTETPMSERPRAFCTEDTPGDFSRADSLSSLDSSEEDRRIYQMSNLNIEDRTAEEKGEAEARHSKETSPMPDSRDGYDKPIQDDLEFRPQTPPGQPPSMVVANPAATSSVASTAPRTVKFNEHETPLMYSRASSIESLNSCDQQSIRTGYSSCDFSRLNSGRVSPSDLPDSPGAITPARRNQSPRRSRTTSERREKTTAPSREVPIPQQHPPPSSLPAPPTSEAPKQQGGSFPQARAAGESGKDFGATETAVSDSNAGPVITFSAEGSVRVFAEEGTPAAFSSKTSLDKDFSTDDEERNDGASAQVQQVQVSTRKYHSKKRT